MTAYHADPLELIKEGEDRMELTGSQIVAEVLLDHGVDTVFGYPGGTALNIYDELYKYSDRIHHVLASHEQHAAHAADGYARATGKTGPYTVLTAMRELPERQVSLSRHQVPVRQISLPALPRLTSIRSLSLR